MSLHSCVFVMSFRVLLPGGDKPVWPQSLPEWGQVWEPCWRVHLPLPPTQSQWLPLWRYRLWWEVSGLWGAWMPEPRLLYSFPVGWDSWIHLFLFTWVYRTPLYHIYHLLLWTQRLPAATEPPGGHRDALQHYSQLQVYPAQSDIVPAEQQGLAAQPGAGQRAASSHAEKVGLCWGRESQPGPGASTQCHRWRMAFCGVCAQKPGAQFKTVGCSSKLWERAVPQSGSSPKCPGWFGVTSAGHFHRWSA